MQGTGKIVVIAIIIGASKSITILAVVLDAVHGPISHIDQDFGGIAVARI